MDLPSYLYADVLNLYADRGNVLSLRRRCEWRGIDFEIVPLGIGDRIVLTPQRFYLLMSDEAVCIPPVLASEMTAYDPTSGELRTHYAGFFDPGFGYAGAGGRGARGVLEVRSREVPFILEHGTGRPITSRSWRWSSSWRHRRSLSSKRRM